MIRKLRRLIRKLFRHDARLVRLERRQKIETAKRTMQIKYIRNRLAELEYQLEDLDPE